MLKLRNNLLLIIGLFSGFVQASELLTKEQKEQLNQQLILVAQGPVENVAEAQRLLDAGADINTIVNRHTALSLAVYKGHINLARKLHARKDLNRIIPSNNLNKLLVITVSNNRIDRVTHALDAGADINFIFNGKTVLSLAVEKGYIDLARMLNSREDLDRAIWQNDLKELLINAVSDNRIDQVRHALDAGADINSFFNGKTVLSLAVKMGHIDLARMLYARKDLNRIIVKHDLSQLLIKAAYKNRIDRVKHAFEFGADVNYYAIEYDDDGTAIVYSALFCAINKNSEEMLRYLIFNTDIKVNALCLYSDNKKYGLTALDLAVSRGYENLVRLLLHVDALVNSYNEIDWTPLHNISANTNEIIIDLLLAKGADINAVNSCQGTPLHNVIDSPDNLAVIKLLLAKGANVNMRNNNGDTPLKLAILNGSIDVVKLLVQEARVNWHLPEHNIDTLITLANAQGHGEVAAFLQQTKDADARWHDVPGTWVAAVYCVARGGLGVDLTELGARAKESRIE